MLAAIMAYIGGTERRFDVCCSEFFEVLKQR